MGDVDWHVRVDVERALEVRDRCLFLLLLFKRVVCADYSALYSQVSSVSFSPDGTKLASVSWDNSVKIWETSTATCVSTLSVDSGLFGVQSISYSPAGDMIVAGCSNGKIHLLDTATVAVKRSLSGHNDPVWSVCFSPCGRKIVSGGGLGEDDEGNGDFSIRIWDAETGTQIGSPLSGHSEW